LSLGQLRAEQLARVREIVLDGLRRHQARVYLFSTIPYKVDLVDLSRTDPAFRKRVQQEGLLWNG